MRTRIVNGIEVTTSSGNVFADEITVQPTADPIGHLTLAVA